MKSIEFLSTGRHDFGKDLDSRVKLENIKLPDMKEIYVNQWYINIFINTLIFSINEGSYTLTGV